MRTRTWCARKILSQGWRLAVVGVASAVALLLMWESGRAQGSAGARGGTTLQAQVPAARAAAPAPNRVSGVSVKNGRVTVRVANRPLAEILAEITGQAQVALAVHDQGLVSRQVSAQIVDLPVEDALRHILKEQDVFFFYGADRVGTAGLRAVWIYARGKGRGLMPVPPEQWASTRELEQALHDRDPETRAKALEALVERKGSGGAEAVMAGLMDEQAQVRTSALYGAMMAGLTLSPATLASLVLSDPSPDVRFLSLQALGNDPTSRTIIEQALQDPSPQIRNAAQDLLRDLGGGGGSSDPSVPAQRQPIP